MQCARSANLGMPRPATLPRRRRRRQRCRCARGPDAARGAAAAPRRRATAQRCRKPLRRRRCARHHTRRAAAQPGQRRRLARLRPRAPPAGCCLLRPSVNVSVPGGCEHTTHVPRSVCNAEVTMLASAGLPQELKDCKRACSLHPQRACKHTRPLLMCGRRQLLHASGAAPWPPVCLWRCCASPAAQQGTGAASAQAPFRPCNSYIARAFLHTTQRRNFYLQSQPGKRWCACWCACASFSCFSCHTFCWYYYIQVASS